ncbi:MAG TPA: hypothetical protein VMV25_06835 [Steroidobacteraceae bacterium]|nr:hypothetical protein [Steroidobacteraceae bacterium]
MNSAIRRDELKISTHISIDMEHEYFRKIRAGWGLALRDAFSALPDPNW